MSAIEMYPIRNIVPHDITVELPTCMYKLKNIHLSKTQMAERLSNIASNGNITAQDISLPDLVMIENRQKLLLNQLEDLKQQLLKVKSILNIEQAQKIECSIPLDAHKEQAMIEVPDILVTVSPKNPPYSLLFIQKLLRNQIQIALTTHWHSNTSGVDENAELFLKKFTQCCDGNSCSSTANIRLIWKTLEMSQLECCVGDSWLLGEVNLLRYLSRLLGNSHYDQQNADEINYILDIIYRIDNAQFAEIKTYLDMFASYLSKNGDTFLCGNELSIADIAAWSALKQLKDVKLNASLLKWMNKCENVIST